MGDSVDNSSLNTGTSGQDSIKIRVTYINEW